MIPRFRPNLCFSDLPAGLLGRGAEEDFEQAFAVYTGFEHALLFPYGRAAAYAFFQVLGVTGKEVILPAYTCRAMVSAVLGAGNRPLFIDCEPEGVNMSATEALAAVSQRTGAICPTAMYGYPFEASSYLSLCGRLPILVDLALGLFNPNLAAGLAGPGSAAFFSLGPGKQTTLLGGGALVTNDPDLYHKVKGFRDQTFRAGREALHKTLAKFLGYWLLFSAPLYRLVYYFSEKTSVLDEAKGLGVGVRQIMPADFLRRINRFQVNLGLRQLGRIERARRKRREVVAAYDQAFRSRELKRLRLLRPYPDCSHYAVFSPEAQDLKSCLLGRGVHATNIFRELVPGLPLVRAAGGGGDFPQARRLTRECLLLPLHDRLTRRQQDRIIETVLEWDRRA